MIIFFCNCKYFANEVSVYTVLPVRAGTNVKIHPAKLLLKMLPKLRSFVTNVVSQLMVIRVYTTTNSYTLL